ncbi:NALP5-like protein [Mya arenaria]|uniref:NALP5-like protein n=1 Tax=Mya arenaria TaxID=6604 RepID=A0ABY7ECW3_MYAAR|nr:NALP5-like protein [Mya arenaria]
MTLIVSNHGESYGRRRLTKTDLKSSTTSQRTNIITYTIHGTELQTIMGSGPSKPKTSGAPNKSNNSGGETLADTQKTSKVPPADEKMSKVPSAAEKNPQVPPAEEKIPHSTATPIEPKLNQKPEPSTNTSEKLTESQAEVPVEEKLIDEGPKEQLKFDCALKSACLLDLDLSFNQMGPQCLRALCLAMCYNTSILSLNLADNKSDTDTAVQSIGMTDMAPVLGAKYRNDRHGSCFRCESIGMTDCRLLIEGLLENSSITDFDMSRNDVSDKAGFGKAMAQCLLKTDCCLSSVCLSRCELTGTTISELQKGLYGNTSLCELNLTGAQMDSLGQLAGFVIMAASHPCLTNLSLDSVRCKSSSLTGDGDTPSNLRKLCYGLNEGDGLSPKVKLFPNLHYLNIRLCPILHEEVAEIGQYISGASSSITTVVLDGLKLSSVDVIKHVVANPKTNKLQTLSIGGCSLDDSDLIPLCDAFRNGLPLSMLKLSANRITDAGVTTLVEAILKCKSQTLGDDGAKTLAKLFTSKSKLHSLNISANNIGKIGLMSVCGLVAGKSPLTTLHIYNQTEKLDEGPINEIYSQLAKSLGYKVQFEFDKVKVGCCDFPANLPDGLLVNLTDMGGHTGCVGQAMDSRCIQTDFIQDRLPYLDFNNIMKISCFLKGHSSGECVWSETEWKMITGADRPTTDAPSWLQVPNMRDRCLYISNLPGTATLQKFEAMLEMDADCNVEETNLMKDPVTRNINGVGWTVMGDQGSVQKAMDYFNSGEAKIFGQAIMLSEVKVKVDNEASAELEKLAQADREKRQKLRDKEESEHRTLIINTTEASWKRHAYRLAHPAYADGRIW